MDYYNNDCYDSMWNEQHRFCYQYVKKKAGAGAKIVLHPMK